MGGGLCVKYLSFWVKWGLLRFDRHTWWFGLQKWYFCSCLFYLQVYHRCRTQEWNRRFWCLVLSFWQKTCRKVCYLSLFLDFHLLVKSFWQLDGTCSWFDSTSIKFWFGWFSWCFDRRLDKFSLFFHFCHLGTIFFWVSKGAILRDFLHRFGPFCIYEGSSWSKNCRNCWQSGLNRFRIFSSFQD